MEKVLAIGNEDILHALFGTFDENVQNIEAKCGVRVVSRNGNLIISGEENGVTKAAGVFEQMCKEYIIRYAENLPILISEVGQWWGTDSRTRKEVQIDIVGTPVDGKEYIIGSCKYKNEKIGVDELGLLKNYAEVFGKGSKYHYFIFSKGGFTEGLKELQTQGEVILVSLEDMYQ